MTICVVCDVLGEENNGTTIAAMNLIRSLREKGHTVRVVCPDEDKKDLPDHFVVGSFGIAPVKRYLKKNGVVVAKPDRDILQAAFDGVDHVHLMTPLPLCIGALRIVREKGISVTAGFHCQAENISSHLGMKDNYLLNKEIYKLFYRHFYRYVDGVHFPTEFIREVFDRYGGKTNAYVISNGVSGDFRPMEVERPAEFDGKQVILFTGRYSKEKSHKVLIDAVKKSRHRDTVQLVFAGEGPLLGKLKKRSETLPNPPIFKYFTRREMVDMINSADLYVHPAEIEIEAISCLEAISCGLVPVISNSPRSATRYFALDEKNLFSCNDSGDLAEKIDYWLDHPDEKAKRSKEYLGYTKQFDFDVCMDRMEQMIIEVHNKKASADNG